MSDVDQFIALTGTDESVAKQWMSGTDLQTAISNYFAAQEASGEPGANAQLEDEDDLMESGPESSTSVTGPSTSGSQVQPQRTGAYTLSGEPVTEDTNLPKGWGKEKARTGRVGQWGSNPSAKQAAQGSGPRIATLGGTAEKDSDSEDESEDERRKRELYAGGEKSGLAIENPGGDKSAGQSVVDEILKRAREGGMVPPPGGSSDAQAPRRSAFQGSGNTLGSDESPSVAVPDPSARPASQARALGGLPGPRGLLASMLGQLGGAGAAGGEEEEEEEEDDEEVAVRHLTFWRDGFSVEDGPLMRYDDPGNRETLEAIKAGRAPLSILNVRNGQAVELRVAQRQTEAYEAPPPRPMRAFEGTGNRLGSPVPALSPASTGSPSGETTGMPGGFTSSAVPPSTEDKVNPAFAIDESKPTTSVQIRLADGTRHVSRLNLNHTVGDIRRFISSVQPGARAYVIMTTFPNKTLEDDSQTIEDAKLQNAVIVQRWT